MDFDSICKCFPGYQKTGDNSNYNDYGLINSENVVLNKANCS
ncbi:hypothetical protein SAMN04487830_14015 [Pseudobutyrivibrio sp. OR37]|nr:hypothetical protein SAMN04487830_14015 [Pseudobutyrivibrio sp. OR37]